MDHLYMIVLVLPLLHLEPSVSQQAQIPGLLTSITFSTVGAGPGTHRYSRVLYGVDCWISWKSLQSRKTLRNKTVKIPHYMYCSTLCTLCCSYIFCVQQGLSDRAELLLQVLKSFLWNLVGKKQNLLVLRLLTTTNVPKVSESWN